MIPLTVIGQKIAQQAIKYGVPAAAVAFGVPQAEVEKYVKTFESANNFANLAVMAPSVALSGIMQNVFPTESKVDASSGTQTGLQDWTTAYKQQDDDPKEVEGEYMSPGSGLPDPGDEDPDDEERKKYNRDTFKKILDEIQKGKKTYEEYKTYRDIFNQVKESNPDLWESFKDDRKFKKSLSKINQQPVETYKDIYYEIYKDPNYQPKIEGYSLWNDPAGILKLPEDRIPGDAVSYPVVNITAGKKETIQQIADEQGITFGAAKSLFEKQLARHIKITKKINREKRLLKQGGQEAVDEYNMEQAAQRRERKYRRRAIKAGDEFGYSETDKVINRQQITLQKSYNDVINFDTTMQDKILNDASLVDHNNKGRLTFTVTSDGEVVNRPVTHELEKIFETEGEQKTVRFYEKDHIESIEGGTQGLHLGANQQVIPRVLHKNFVGPAEKFIAANYNNPEAAEKIKNIIATANELQITLSPNVPKGSLKDFGFAGRRVGFKQPSYVGSVVGRVRDNVSYYTPYVKIADALLDKLVPESTTPLLPKKAKGGRVGFSTGGDDWGKQGETMDVKTTKTIQADKDSAKTFFSQSSAAKDVATGNKKILDTNETPTFYQTRFAYPDGRVFVHHINKITGEEVFEEEQLKGPQTWNVNPGNRLQFKNGGLVDINDVKYIINHEHGEKGLDVFGFIKDTTKEMLKRR